MKPLDSPESSKENPPTLPPGPGVAIFVGKVGSPEVVEVQFSPLIARDGSIGLPAIPLDNLVVDLKPDAVLWIRPAANGATNEQGEVEKPIEFLGGAVKIDLTTRRLLVEDQIKKLPKTEFGVLEALASNQGRVLSVEQIMDRVWGDQYRTPHSVKVAISKIRKVLGEHRELIHTVYDKGYTIDSPEPELPAETSS